MAAMPLPALLLTLLITVLTPAAAPAHEAQLDGFGCHVSANQKTYQCHRGLLAGHTFGSRAEMLYALEGTRPVRDGATSSEVTLHPARTDPPQVCIRENFTKQIMCGEALR